MKDNEKKYPTISIDEINDRIKKANDEHKVVDEYIQKVKNQIDEGLFDLLLFINDLNDLEESTRDLLLRKIAWAYPGPRVLSNQPLTSSIKFFEFLDSKNYFKTSTELEFARGFVSDPLENKTELLLYIIKNIKSLSVFAVSEIAKTESGLDELEKLIISDYEEYQEVVALGLGDVIAPGFLDSLNVPSVNYNAHPKVTVILNKLVRSTGDKSSYLVSRALYIAYSLSLESIEKLLKSSDYRQRNFALKYYEHSRLKAKDAKSHMPFVVELLEDERIDVSKNALEAIRYFSSEYSSVVAEVILDLLVVRSSNRPQQFFNSFIVVSALKEAINLNPRLQGIVLHNIKDIAVKSSGSTRNRAVFVGIGINKKEFLALISEIQDVNPAVAKSIANIVSGSLESSQIVNQISETDPKDIQQNAANQISLLTKYYENGLSQAKSSFNWAIGITVLSVLAFIVIVFYFGKNQDKTIIWATAVASGLAELIAGTLLFMYQKTLSQLNNYNHQMSKIQNYLLANSFIESLDQVAQSDARLELIRSDLAPIK